MDLLKGTRNANQREVGKEGGDESARILQPILLTISKHNASTKALREAIVAFPSVVPLLADKADISLPGEVRSHTAFRIQADPRYGAVDHASRPGIDIYVARFPTKRTQYCIYFPISMRSVLPIFGSRRRLGSGLLAPWWLP
jgi:hypothetical protein